MKFRKDFVTNSSSSSYVCEICGRTETGFDMGLSDCDMAECVNGHVFCNYEMPEKPTKVDMVKYIMEHGMNVTRRWIDSTWQKDTLSEVEMMEFDEDVLWCDFMTEDGYYEIPECMCPICSFEEYSQSDMCSFLLKEYGVSREEVFAEVKKINKRRRKLYDSEYITYVCQKFDLNAIEISTTWKDRFGSYKAFQDYIYSR